MNAKVSARVRTKADKVLKVVGVAAAAALLVGASSAFAESHGGGFGGGHVASGHFSAPHFAGAGHVAGAHFSAAPHYYGGGVHAQVRAGGAYGYRGGTAFRARGYVGYGSRPGWGGGYWGGGYWPRAYYGWSYPFLLGALPALYATYWWDGVPYYYVNDVYYTWNAGDNGYIATDPPPVSGDYSDDVNAAAAAAGPDSANSQDATPQDVAPAGPAPGIIAYPRNGQSDQQQSKDKFECHNWAKGQTGFDPTSQSSSGASPDVRSSYSRAMAACLDARGYTVR
ncbi:MAG TPA: hypothetical protein VGG49_04840 [Steroidobacteraceae bacterium]|jgi:hypothetical protein